MSQDMGKVLHLMCAVLRRMRSGGTTYRAGKATARGDVCRCFCFGSGPKQRRGLQAMLAEVLRMELLDIVSESSDQFEGAVK